MKNKKINEQIINVWKEFEHADPNLLAPIFYDDFKKKRPILFISLNPSFNKKAIKKFLKETHYKNYDFVWSKVSKKNPGEYVKEIVEIEGLAKEYPFYKKFKELATCLNSPWEHIDLFFFRQTKQNEFKKFICTDKKQIVLTDFGKKQLKISLGMIELIQPSIILVANASASGIVIEKKEIFSGTFTKYGFHTTEVGNRKVPIFFSSMISGQRALDNNSFERLKWHMKEALTAEL